MATLRRAVATALACGLTLSAPSPVAQAAEGEIFFGAQWWDQTVPDAKYQEFSQVPRGTFIQSFLLREWSGRNSVALWGANAIRTDQASRFTWANGVRWRVDLGYAKIPHNFSQIARWGWAENADGVFTLPDTLQARNQQIPGSYTQRMTDFLRNAPLIDLGVATRISTVRARARPARGWQFEVRGSNRDRSGLKPYALDFGFNTALENPEPIDQRMVDADAIASYQRDRLSAQLSAGLSRFDNSISTLVVDNPKRLVDAIGGDGPKVGALDLYPDNQVIRGSMAIAYLLPRRTALAATLSMARGKQDDPFLPFTSNTLLPQSSLDSLPARSLDGKTVQLNGDVRLTTSPVAGLDGALRLHYTDYDNQTQERNFIGQSPYDVSWQRFIEMRNHIFSNKQWQAGLDLDYAVAPRVKVGAIAEYRVRDRTEREVDKDNETVLGGRARLRPLDGLEVTGKYTHGDRKLDKFLDAEYRGLASRTVPAGSAPWDTLLYDVPAQLEQPDLRRFDVANRVQNQATAGVSYMPGERVELSASYAYTKNDYPDTKLGLQDETMHTGASSATVHVNDRLDLNGGYGFGRTETNQASRASGAVMTALPDSNWSADITDKEVFVFTGIDWAPTPKITVAADYQFSRNVTDFDLGNGLNNAADLPRNVYRRHEALLDASWRWLENTTIVGRWGWEEYDIVDWATNNVPLIFPVTGTANAIFVGDSSQGYKAHRVALLVRHKF
jgi:MtrB/PioB family decaheme-associated outer membrane protein